MKISQSVERCNGQEADGTKVCAYKESCLRHKSDDDGQRIVRFHLGGDDCASYLSFNSDYNQDR